MVTALKTENENSTITTEQAATAAPVADVDVSAVPETPAELLKQWDVSKRPLIHTIFAATLVRLWDALVGPGMTEQQRLHREIAEAKGNYSGFIKLA